MSLALRVVLCVNGLVAVGRQLHIAKVARSRFQIDLQSMPPLLLSRMALHYLPSNRPVHACETFTAREPDYSHAGAVSTFFEAAIAFCNLCYSFVLGITSSCTVQDS